MVALSGKGSRFTWDQLELLMVRWRRIEALLAPGPVIYLVTRSHFWPLKPRHLAVFAVWISGS